MAARGYRKVRKEGKIISEHHLVWCQEHGELPEGMVIHHIDGNKKNNALSNLQLLSISDHNKIHAGFTKKGDSWFKKCPCCGEVKEINADNWYLNKKDNSVATGYCKICFRKKMKEYERKRRKQGLCCG